MTAKIAEVARCIACNPDGIDAVHPNRAPESIEGYVDMAFSIPGLLTELERARSSGYDGYCIACFDDTGLDAARSISEMPVVGIGEAAFHVACLVAHRFSVVTTLPRSIPTIENNLSRYGLRGRCVRVRAANVPVLALEESNSTVSDLIAAEIKKAIKEDQCEAIVLGCAGMADLAQEFSNSFGIPVIEGVSASVKLLESLASLKLRTSKSGGWAYPNAKPYLSAALATAGQ